MEYTIQKLALLAGVTPRTLRYYDQIGLLKPARASTNGYRIYGQAEVDRLQQILLYRELELGLDEIKELLDDPSFDRKSALMNHQQKLLAKKGRLERIIELVDRSIQAEERMITMTDQEKFDAFKDQLVHENEAQYGKEIREQYGDQTVDASNAKLMGLSEADFAEQERLNAALLEALKRALEAGEDARSETAQEAARLHQAWIHFFWPSYTKEAHLGLVDMYVADDRFKRYYDEQSGTHATELLREAVQIYLAE
ncbi:MerR family transcriptional regulator [Listeria costaricensis]|uniref:MerR family transcriptional regulator n=1 Tax=Listeria costaricensis TaxID=2026604 RepID=UPI000C07BE45|nr:MerR family transcriptional regulator [Listeria costaricensis]